MKHSAKNHAHILMHYHYEYGKNQQETSPYQVWREILTKILKETNEDVQDIYSWKEITNKLIKFVINHDSERNSSFNEKEFMAVKQDCYEQIIQDSNRELEGHEFKTQAFEELCIAKQKEFDAIARETLNQMFWCKVLAKYGK